jgi:hypothetical protein
MGVFLGFALGAVTVWACMKMLQWDKDLANKKKEFKDTDKSEK